MHILWLDPFHSGSHAAVAEGYAQHSRHTITLLSLNSAGGWRWRMHGAAVSFARMLRERFQAGKPPAHLPIDLVVTTDMLDLASFLGFTRDLIGHVPVALYMHENQLTYPLPPGRTRDLAYPWINYTSALAAGAVCFNSGFHRRIFLESLPELPGRFHDYQELDLIESIAAKSHVLYPGIDLTRLDIVEKNTGRTPNTPPIILWNSRWEYDKAPEAFFEALQALVARGVDFRVIVAGEHIDPKNPAFLAAKQWLAPYTLAWGYAPDTAAYSRLLHQADIVVSTAIQEFFGIAVLEAIYCGCIPVLPERLSYPELLPEELHPHCLYNETLPLAEQLERVIHTTPELQRHDFRAVAARFAWQQMAPAYDTLFERVIQH